jgi:hypothetical protein
MAEEPEKIFNKPFERARCHIPGRREILTLFICFASDLVLALRVRSPSLTFGITSSGHFCHLEYP